MWISSLARDFSYTYQGTTLSYTVIDEDAKTCEVKFGRFASGDIVIPDCALANWDNDDFEIYKVTEIGWSAFYNNTWLNSVTIPNTVETIGRSAFEGCSWLTSVEIPNSVQTIGRSAFANCTKLTSVVIGNSVQTIGNEAFCACSKLISVTIPPSVTSIGADAFKDCSMLKKSAYPNKISNPFPCGVKIAYNPEGAEIEDGIIWGPGKNAIWYVPYDFKGAYEIPTTVETIGGSAFESCSGLILVVIGNSVQSIGGNAFYGCSGLTSVIIGNSVESIGGNAFYSCSGLTSVIIGNSVQTIARSAFSNCSGLNSVVIPNSVQSIGNYAFSGCAALKSIYYNTKKPVTADKSIFSDYSVPTLYVPESTIDNLYPTMPWYLFRKKTYEFGCITLDKSDLSMLIGDRQTIKTEVIGNLSELSWTSSDAEVATVDADGVVTAVGAGEAVITVSATDLNINEVCTAVCYVTVSAPIINLDRSALSMLIGYRQTLKAEVIGNLSELSWTSSDTEVVTVDADGVVTAVAAGEAVITVSTTDLNTNKVYTTTCNVTVSEAFANTLGYKLRSGKLWVSSFTAAGPTDVIIPELATYNNQEYDVIGIMQSAFAANTNLRSVTIPKSITDIDPGAFTDCANLETVNYFPEKTNNTTSHWSNPVFANCPKFKNLNIGESVTEIPPYMFKTTALEKVVIADNVETLRGDCFTSCLQLSEIYIGRGVSRIENFSFGLENEEAAPTTKVICNAEQITYYRGLKGETLTTSYAPFYNRTISSIEFGPDVQRLYDYAFFDIAPNDIYCLGDTPPTVASTTALRKVNKSTCRLHVPADALSLYKSTNFWKDFYNIIDDLAGIGEVTVDPDDSPVEVYNLNGLRVADSLDNLAPGFYIVRQGGKTQKIALTR